jgi:cytosine permease
MRWFQLSTIQTGGAICLPVILLGQMLVAKFGLGAALTAILLGNLLVTLIGVGQAAMSIRYREITVVNARRYLGIRGATLYGAIYMVVAAGWFAVQLDLMGSSVSQLIGLPVAFWNLVLGGLVTAVVLTGLRGLGRLATLSLPLLLATLGYTCYLSGLPIAPLGEMKALAIGMVVAMEAGPIFNLPNFLSQARTKRDAMITVILVWGIMLPLIEMVGVCIGSASPGSDFFGALTAGGSLLWGAVVTLFLVFAGWTTNNNNLYGTALTLQALISRLGRRSAVLLYGSVATAISCLPLLDHFPLFLGTIGVSVGSVGSVVLSSFLLERFATAPIAMRLFAWGIGTAMGLLSLAQIFSLTGVAPLDAMITAALTNSLLTLTAQISIRGGSARVASGRRR